MYGRGLSRGEGAEYVGVDFEEVGEAEEMKRMIARVLRVRSSVQLGWC